MYQTHTPIHVRLINPAHDIRTPLDPQPSGIRRARPLRRTRTHPLGRALSSDKSAITAAVLRLIILVNNGYDWPGALFARRAHTDGFGFCVMEFDDGAKPLCLHLRRRLRRSTDSALRSLSVCILVIIFDSTRLSKASQRLFKWIFNGVCV